MMPAVLSWRAAELLHWAARSNFVTKRAGAGILCASSSAPVAATDHSFSLSI